MRRCIVMICIAIAVHFSSGARAAAVLNGSFSVTTGSSVSTIADQPGFTNLTLANGVPQSLDLFDIFSTGNVAAQPISVGFDLVETGVGPLTGTVIGSITGVPGPEDLGSVSFAPQTIGAPGPGQLLVALSAADFGNDFNGTVMATFTQTVPEPPAWSLLGLAVTGLAAASLCRRGFRPGSAHAG